MELREKRILIVEDEYLTALDLKNQLEDNFYQVCGMARDGEEALKIYHQHKPNLVLMDITLAGKMTGIETARQIRQFSDLPLLYLTAHSGPSIFKQAKSTNPYGYIPKPIIYQNLFAAIEIAYNQYQISRELQQSEEKFRSIFLNSRIGILLYNEKGKVIDANPAVINILEARDREALLGLSLFTIKGFSDKVHEEIIKGEFIHEQIEYDFSWVKKSHRYETKRSGKAYFDLICSPYKQRKRSGEEIKGYLLQVQDITQSRKIQEESDIQKQKLIQADKLASLGTLVTGVAHEINNPNQSIMANAAFIKDAWTSALPVLDSYYQQEGDFLLAGLEYSAAKAEVFDYLNLIEDCSRRINTIVKDLKDFGRYQPKHTLQPVSVNLILHRALVLMSHYIKKHTHHLEVEYGRDVKTIMANPQTLGQVFINIIQNACEALPDKEKKIIIRSFTQNDGPIVCVEIIDQGGGIPPEILDRVRDPFFTTKDANGTGLGLAISSTIMDDHNGTMDFINTKDGTRVILSFPALANKEEEGGIT